MLSFRPHALSILALVFVALPAAAQVADPVTTAEAPVPGAGHDYIGMPTETVNPADGSLSFHLTIKTPAGRELSFPFGISYRSTEPYYLINYSNDTTLSWHPRPTTYGESYGWSYDLPSLSQASEVNYVQPVYSQLGQLEGWNQCDASLAFTFRGLDGKQYTFGLGAQWTDPDSYQLNGCTVYQTPTSSLHSMYAQFTGGTWSQWPNQPPVTVTDQSGTLYQFPSTSFGNINPSLPGPVISGFAQTITDRNGNQIELNSGGNGYTDTLGRQVVSWSAQPGTAANLTIAGYSNPYQLSYASVSSSYSVSIQNVGGTNCTGGTSVGGTYL